MSIIKWLIGNDADKEHDEKLLEDVVAYYQPSMKVVGRMLTMDAKEGRRTARTFGDSEPTNKE